LGQPAKGGDGLFDAVGRDAEMPGDLQCRREVRRDCPADKGEASGHSIGYVRWGKGQAQPARLPAIVLEPTAATGSSALKMDTAGRVALSGWCSKMFCLARQ